MINMHGIRFPRAGLLLLASLLTVGCADEGPKMYDLTGKVTHGGEPVLIGDVVLEPLQGPVTGQTVIRTSVVEGEYRTRTVGGPHRVNVRDFSGDPEMGGEEYANARPRFRREYSGKVELPALDSVEEGQTVTQDIEIPASHR